VAPPGKYNGTFASFDPSESTTQMANRSVQQFLHSSLQSVIGHIYTTLRIQLWTWAHWRNLANMIELLLHCIHWSPQTKREVYRFNRFCTSHGITWEPVSAKIAPSHGGSEPWSNTWFVGLISAHNTNGISIGSAIFLHRCPLSVPVLDNGTPLPPLKIAASHGGCGHPSNTWFPWPTQVLNPNGILICSVVLARCASLKGSPTDRPL